MRPSLCSMPNQMAILIECVGSPRIAAGLSEDVAKYGEASVPSGSVSMRRVARVAQRVFQIVLPEAPMPERWLAYHFSLSAARTHCRGQRLWRPAPSAGPRQRKCHPQGEEHKLPFQVSVRGLVYRK